MSQRMVLVLFKEIIPHNFLFLKIERDSNLVILYLVICSIIPVL